MAGGESPGYAGHDVADAPPTPTRSRPPWCRRGSPLGFFTAVAVDEGGALLRREGDVHLARDPLVDVDRRVVEQGRRRRRHRVELRHRIFELDQRRRVGLRSRVRLAHPARLEAGGGERPSVAVRRDDAHPGNRADRRNDREAGGRSRPPSPAAPGSRCRASVTEETAFASSRFSPPTSPLRT